MKKIITRIIFTIAIAAMTIIGTPASADVYAAVAWGGTSVEGALVKEAAVEGTVAEKATAGEALMAENSDDGASSEEIKVTLNHKKLTLEVGQKKIKLKVKGVNVIKFKSTNKAVAKVTRHGNAYAKGAGK